MKKILFGSLMALACVVAFTSCGSDKDEILQIIPAIINPPASTGATITETDTNITYSFTETVEGVTIANVWSFEFDANGICTSATFTETSLGFSIPVDMTDKFKGQTKDQIRTYVSFAKAEWDRENGVEPTPTQPTDNPAIPTEPTITENENTVIFTYAKVQNSATAVFVYTIVFDENNICTDATIAVTVYVAGVGSDTETDTADSFIGLSRDQVMLILNAMKEEQTPKPVN